MSNTVSQLARKKENRLILLLTRSPSCKAPLMNRLWKLLKERRMIGQLSWTLSPGAETYLRMPIMRDSVVDDGARDLVKGKQSAGLSICNTD